jgi:hypothetical protein
MGIDKLRHIQKRLDAEKKSSERKKNMTGMAKGMLFSGAMFSGVIAGAAGIDAISKVDQKLDTPPILLKLSAEKDKIPVEEFTAQKRALPEKLILSVALLAHSYTPKYADFEKDPALQDADKVNKGLVLPLVQRKNVDATFWQDLSREFRSTDPATADVRLDLLKDLSGKYGGVEPVELGESIAYVARNLHFKDQEPTTEGVRAEVRSILDRRESLARENLFDRDTMLISADALWDTASGKAQPRFGNQELSDELQKKLHMSGNATATFSHVTPLFQDVSGWHSNAETVAKAKHEALEKIASSEKPLTVYFGGHGGYGRFFLSTTLANTDSESINFYELANVLGKRWRSELIRDPHAKELPVTLIFDDCMMQTFVRSLSTELAAHKVPLPHIMITASEWEQYGYSDSSIGVGSAFGELVVKSPNLGALMEQKHTVKTSDPSVFAPRQEDPKKLMQISGIVVPSSVA